MMLEQFKIGLNVNGFYELAKMTKEQYIKFRNAFVEERMYKQEFIKNANRKAMDNILNAICMIICKKLPNEISTPPTLHMKVKLVAPKADPKPEKAVVTLSIATTKASMSDVEDTIDDIKDGMKEIDQEKKSVAINCRIAALPYRVVVINQYAARWAREDFLEAIKKAVPETFKDKEGEKGDKTFKKIMQLSEKMCIQQD